MNILIIGSGGREHSIAWAIKQNPICKKIYCIPGNAGISKIAECHDLNIMDNNQIIDFCKENQINFVIIGPEKPLSNGIVNDLTNNSIMSFGPNQEASMLETSKNFTKRICEINNIPTAKYKVFNDFEGASNYVLKNNGPFVIKADGLAEGKGVSIEKSKESAIKTIKNMFEGQFGDSGKTILIEEFLTGTEVSFFVLTDGETILPLGSAQDYKKAFDNDKGPNTGGMGAVSPSPIFDKNLEAKTINKIIKPTLEHLKKDKIKYCGILYAGLIIKNNEPKLIEYNVRFGDPECQVILMRIGAQILDLFLDCAFKNLKYSKVNWIDNHTINVVIASDGYPKDYEKGKEIYNLQKLNNLENIQVFHAGTKEINGKVFSNGGRVLNICGRSKTLAKARKLVYQNITKINWGNGFYRKDIGKFLD